LSPAPSAATVRFCVAAQRPPGQAGMGLRSRGAREPPGGRSVHAPGAMEGPGSRHESEPLRNKGRVSHVRRDCGERMGVGFSRGTTWRVDGLQAGSGIQGNRGSGEIFSGGVYGVRHPSTRCARSGQAAEVKATDERRTASFCSPPAPPPRGPFDSLRSLTTGRLGGSPYNSNGNGEVGGSVRTTGLRPWLLTVGPSDLGQWRSRTSLSAGTCNR